MTTKFKSCPKGTLKLPPVARLREILDYSYITGDLYWKVSTSRRVKVGEFAGSFHKTTGYRQLKIDGTVYKAHRIIWKLVTGKDPGLKEVDHKDGCRTHNAWHNLRLATQGPQSRNQKLGSNNTSGFKGVSWHKPRQKWRAAIRSPINSNTMHIGYYTCPQQAHYNYCRLGHILHGSFFNSGGTPASEYLY